MRHRCTNAIAEKSLRRDQAFSCGPRFLNDRDRKWPAGRRPYFGSDFVSRRFRSEAGPASRRSPSAPHSRRFQTGRKVQTWPADLLRPIGHQLQPALLLRGGAGCTGRRAGRGSRGGADCATAAASAAWVLIFDAHDLVAFVAAFRLFAGAGMGAARRLRRRRLWFIDSQRHSFQPLDLVAQLWRRARIRASPPPPSSRGAVRDPIRQLMRRDEFLFSLASDSSISGTTAHSGEYISTSEASIALTIVVGVMPCSSLYASCLARRRSVSSIAMRIESVITYRRT